MADGGAATGLNTARSAGSASSASLSFQQASELNSRKDALKDEHVKYVDEHPELKHIMSDFLSQVLLMKPSDIRSFAKDYFANYLPVQSTSTNAPLCLCGPSGAGKGSLVKRLFEEFGDRFGLSVSHTTRRPRAGEEDGVHYHFTNPEAMQEAIDQGRFIEYAHVHSNIYGTSISAVQEVCSQGKVCILEIDIQGVRAVRKTSLNPKCVFISPPSLEVLEERLRARATETEAELAQRLENAKEEMAWLEDPTNVDKKIVNDDLDRAYAELRACLVQWYPSLLGGEAGAQEGKLDESKA